jgi:hypothetical protein
MEFTYNSANRNSQSLFGESHAQYEDSGLGPFMPGLDSMLEE